MTFEKVLTSLAKGLGYQTGPQILKEHYERINRNNKIFKTRNRNIT